MKTAFAAIAALTLGLATTANAAHVKRQPAPPLPPCTSYVPPGYAAPQCGKDPLDNNRNFDYVIVGSGAGGGPLAVRLAQQGFAVLVLEAGSDYTSPNTTVPAFHARSNEDPNIEFNYSVSQGLPNRDKVWYPRVGSLGGCTIHNAMIHMYPHPKDFNDIAQTFNDSSFANDNMRKYFQRIETSNTFCDAQNAGHGYGGWLQTQSPDVSLLYNPPDSQLIDLFTGLVSALPGTPGGDVNAINGTSTPGWHLIPSAISPQKQRSSVYDMIQDELNREASQPPICKLSGNDQKANQNVAEIRPLTVWTNALATSLEIDAKNNVRGVRFTFGRGLYRASPLSANAPPPGAMMTVYAKREVILSAGTFNTPQILQLSGIGDRNQIGQFDGQKGGPGAPGYKFRNHLPGVGKNLQDRYEITVNVAMQNDWELLKGCKFLADSSDPCYVAYQQGLQSTCASKKWQSNIYSTSGAFLGVVQKSQPTLPEPDVYIIGFPFLFNGYIRGYPQKLADAKNVFSYLVLKAHTNNTLGQVTISSTDYRDTPNINFNYFADGDGDLAVITQTVQQVRYLANSNQYVKEELLPGSQVQTDDQVRNYIKQNSWGHHACGTAKMGPASDPMAVVDNNFKVYGVNGLRIVDASVWPKIPGFYIATPTYMLSEKASDVIMAAAASGVCPRV